MAPSAAPVDPAFASIPKNRTYFAIWRVEKLKVVPVPREQYGVFFTGDSYIVYSAGSQAEIVASASTRGREVKGPLEMHIHFWLGAESTADEAGVAAYKTVELDDHLGGAPIQHRETQGMESKRFLAYFKDGIRLMTGGVASGFSHVTNDLTPKLYSVKGRRTPIVRQLSSVSWDHMNDGDSYVLDLKDAIFVWNGKNANNREKLQAAKVASKLRAEHGGSHVVFVDDGSEFSLPHQERDLFAKYLPLKHKIVRSSRKMDDVDSDSKAEKKSIHEVKLYRCSDEGGTLKVTEVKPGPLHQSDLSSEDSFIIDCGQNGIWVWIGKRATQKERAEAMRNAQGFIKKKGYPERTPVTRVIDGGEPLDFKAIFRSWKDKDQTVGLGRQASVGKIARTVQTKFDASILHENPSLSAQAQMVDDGTGQKEVWRINNFGLVSVDPKYHGQFYSGDCYIVLYAYSTGDFDHFIIYYWLGANSSQDEQGTAALKTIELDDKLGGKPVQVRVVQGKEPTHFMSIFGGKMVIFSGGFASSFDGPNAKDTSGPKDKYLLQVRGTSKYNTKAVEVDCRAASLNSNDVFVLKTKQATYVWAGKGSTGDEREMGKEAAAAGGGPADPVLVFEGQENQEFWEAIGGKEPYASDRRLGDEHVEQPARLFQCSNASGVFKAEEIVDFTQMDLIPDDVMMLDAWESIFLWIGDDSNREERKLAEQMALEYLAGDPAKRENTTMIKVKQGYEPPNFTGFFGVWDRTLWNRNKTYEDMKKEMMETNPGIEKVTAQMRAEVDANLPVFPLEQLRVTNPEELPEAVDATRKEAYLSKEDFHLAFGMDEATFDALPQWRRQQLKKAAGLF